MRGFRTNIVGKRVMCTNDIVSLDYNLLKSYNKIYGVPFQDTIEELEDTDVFFINYLGFLHLDDEVSIYATISFNKYIDDKTQELKTAIVPLLCCIPVPGCEYKNTVILSKTDSGSLHFVLKDTYMKNYIPMINNELIISDDLSGVHLAVDYLDSLANYKEGRCNE